MIEVIFRASDKTELTVAKGWESLTTALVLIEITQKEVDEKTTAITTAIKGLVPVAFAEGKATLDLVVAKAEEATINKEI